MRRGLFWTDPRLSKSKRVYLPVSAPWLETFEAELATFPLCKYCDQVDSMVYFRAFLDNRNPVTNKLSALKDCREQPF